MSQIYGFCAVQNKQAYRCANCGYERTFTQVTNLYKPTEITWDDKTCTKCGFKSLKPMLFGDVLKNTRTDMEFERLAKELAQAMIDRTQHSEGD